MKEKKVYYKKLDIIRSLSCIMVLLYHLNILKGGFLAVCTFFVLSGYLTCISALKDEKFSIKSYYINRFKKIYIPLVVIVFITVILAKLHPNIIWINLKKETISVLFGYNNFWQLNVNQDYFTKNLNSPFIHLWYISILMQFDLIFPIVFLCLKKCKKNISTIIVLVFTITATVLFYYMSKTKDIMIVYYSTFSRIFSVFYGIMLAIFTYKYNLTLSKKLKRIDNKIFNIYICIFILLSIFVSAKSKYFSLFMILTSIISARMIEYATIQEKHIEKLDIIIKIIAKISYEIYLIQFPIIFFFQNIVLNRVIKICIISILTFIFSFILHLILHYKFKNKIIKKLKIIIIGFLIIIGSYLITIEKDHTAEMKELEIQINENSKLIEQKNEEYINSISQTNIEDKKPEISTENIENVESEIAKKVSNLNVVGIGDSVLLGAINELYKKFPNGYFDGKVSRTILAAEDVIKKLKNNGKLGNIVILSLANNGDYSTKRNKELMEILDDRKVYWVNAVGADDPTFNEKFKQFSKDYSNIHIIEWDNISKNHPEYFYADGIHTKGEGIIQYAQTIYNAILKDYLEEFKN